MIRRTQTSSEGTSEGYWYPGQAPPAPTSRAAHALGGTEEPPGEERPTDDSAVALLGAVRRFRTADHLMRRRVSAGMDMNATDLAALRHLIEHERAGETVTPLQLARHLGISGASTSKLLDRLTASGHLRRERNPGDGRSFIVVPTDHAHAQVRERLQGMHARMHDLADAVPPPARAAAIAFLLAMADLLDEEAVPEVLTPPAERETPP